MPVSLPFAWVSSMEDVQSNFEQLSVDAVGHAGNINTFQTALSIASGGTQTATYTGTNWNLTTSPQNFVVLINYLDTANTNRVTWTLTAITANSVTVQYFNAAGGTATGTALVTLLIT